MAQAKEKLFNVSALWSTWNSRDQMPKIYDALQLEGLTHWKCSSSWVTAWCVPLRWAPATACAVA